MAGLGPPAGASCGTWLSECSTSTSTCSGKMRNATWMDPVGPAASSSARNTVSPTSRFPSSVSGDSARHRRTKSRMSGIDDGRAGKTCISTTTGMTWIGSSPGPIMGSVTDVSLRPRPYAEGGGPQAPASVIDAGHAGQKETGEVTDGPHPRRWPPMTTPDEPVVHILWMNGGLGCDGDSVALTAATQPSIEEIALGALPGLPKIAVHWPLIDYECGPETGADTFIEWWHKADRGELDPFVLVVEGSIPNEAIKEEGYWCGFGNNPATGQPMTTNEWLDRLAPKATAILAVGTCATYGGIHAMAGNPTGAMGVPDYLGWEWRSKAGLPIVCVPGCPIHPDNLSETILYLLYQVAGQAPMIPLDEALRPTWLFGATVHEGCDRAGYYEQGDFASEYGSPKCLVKLGCWGPVVKCNVPKRGWINGVGGCPNVGGICIACTMPGFPDKFMPFM